MVLDLAADDGAHRIEVGFQPGEAKRLRVDGALWTACRRSRRARS